jgi:hypothetical protein
VINLIIQIRDMRCHKAFIGHTLIGGELPELAPACVLIVKESSDEGGEGARLFCEH